MSQFSFDPAAWRRVSPYLDQVFDLARGEREAWLIELGATQPTIEFLAEQDLLEAQGFLDDPPLDLIEAARAASSMVGRHLGPYTIERLIGRGGMGEVWLASRNDGRFDGRYAIKFLDASLPREKLADRFHREGRLLGRLTHPHIARLIDAGTAEGGRQYLVLEYVDGDRIDRYCDERSLGVTARVRLFLAVASAVAHAHTNLVIHRDLKPSNVLVTADGTVKLLDFGVAKLLSADPTRDATLTGFDGTAFTPEYAAPEQLLGEIPSTATDVYQLGMLLYVLLTGVHPLQSSVGRVERVKAALDGRVRRASESVTGPTRKQLRGDLDAILSMAMRNYPDERYATAAALREDLERYLNREPVSAQRGAALYRARKFVLRHQLALGVVAVALASLCAALVFAFAQARSEAAQRDYAIALAARNAAVTEFLGTVITEGAEADTPVTTGDLLARSEKLALADKSGNRENRAAVLEMIASRYAALDDDATAARLLESALQLTANSSDHALRSKLACAHALSIGSLGQIDVAIRAISHELDHLGADPENAAYCALYRSFIADSYDDAENSLRYATRALERFRAIPRSPTIDEGFFLGALAESYGLNGRNREADQYFRQALQKYTDLGRDSSTNALTVRTNWATMTDTAGEPQRALQQYEQISRLMKERDPDSPLPPYLLGDRARALESLGRYAEARAANEAELQLGTQRHDVLRTAHGLLGLASVAQRLHETPAAKHYLDQVRTVLSPAVPLDTPPWIALWIVQGRIDLEAGNLDAARVEFARLLEKAVGAQGIAARLGKAEAELLADDAAAAAKDAQSALQATMSMQGGFQYSNATGLAWLMLGRAQQKLGDATQAYKAFDAAVRHLSNTVDDGHAALADARRLLAMTHPIRQ
jgi:tetratricopeptide (TPR) repeat protein